MRDSIGNVWKAMLEREIVDEEFDQPTHVLGDVVCFLVNYVRVRMKTGNHIKRLKGESLLLLSSIRHSVLEWFAARVDCYIVDWYQKEHTVNIPPPSLTRGSPSKGSDQVTDVPADRPYKVLAIETIWDIFEDARGSNSSVSNVLQIRQNDGHAGSHRTCDQWWVNKYHSLYDRC